MCLRLAFLIAFFQLPFSIAAQQHNGRVTDLLSNSSIKGVLITNTRSGALWLSDSSGVLSFTAYPGDVIRFSHAAYKNAEVRVNGYNDSVSIAMERAPIELKGVEVLSPMARYARDSAFNRLFFRKKLGYAGSQISFGSGGTGGLVSQLALSLTGKRKAAKDFYREYKFLDEMRYSSIRYTSALVSAQTGLNDTAAEQFIARNPIPIDYLRVVSELELKMRIRELYREDLKKDSLIRKGEGYEKARR